MQHISSRLFLVWLVLFLLFSATITGCSRTEKITSRQPTEQQVTGQKVNKNNLLTNNTCHKYESLQKPDPAKKTSPKDNAEELSEEEKAKLWLLGSGAIILTKVTGTEFLFCDEQKSKNYGLFSYILIGNKPIGELERERIKVLYRNYRAKLADVSLLIDFEEKILIAPSGHWLCLKRSGLLRFIKIVIFVRYYLTIQNQISSVIPLKNAPLIYTTITELMFG